MYIIMATYSKQGVIQAYFRGEGNAKTGNRSLSTSEKGRTLYSYNTPIAYVSAKGNGVYLNKDKYSVTTSSQQNAFKREASSRGIEYQEVSSKELNEKVQRED